jgi:hypothetical protein
VIGKKQARGNRPELEERAMQWGAVSEQCGAVQRNAGRKRSQPCEKPHMKIR